MRSDCLGQGYFCQPKVENLGVPTLGHENVCGLDVPMNDTLRVSRVQSVGDLDPERQHYLHVQGPTGDAVLQGHSVEKLHRDECFAVLVVNFVNRADVGMVQGRGGLGFALKAAECLRVFGYVVGQELECDKPAELHILSLVHHTHPSTTELLNDAVVRDGLADHWSRILRLENQQVNESDGVGGD